MSDSIENILCRLKECNPPINLNLLEELSKFEWDKLDSNKIETACELILRINAEVIVCMFDLKDDLKNIYKELFFKIYKNIKQSNINEKSEEFEEYFNKYSLYISQLN
jgi:hypothetical protein